MLPPIPPGAPTAESVEPLSPWAEALDVLLPAVRLAAAEMDLAFADISADERRFIAENAAILLEEREFAPEKPIEVKDRETREQEEKGAMLLEIAGRVRERHIARAGQIVARAVDLALPLVEGLARLPAGAAGPCRQEAPGRHRDGRRLGRGRDRDRDGRHRRSRSHRVHGNLRGHHRPRRRRHVLRARRRCGTGAPGDHPHRRLGRRRVRGRTGLARGRASWAWACSPTSRATTATGPAASRSRPGSSASASSSTRPATTRTPATRASRARAPSASACSSTRGATTPTTGLSSARPSGS